MQTAGNAVINPYRNHQIAATSDRYLGLAEDDSSVDRQEYSCSMGFPVWNRAARQPPGNLEHWFCGLRDYETPVGC
jgi:hypothetical protein